jgi:ribosome biogenesis SPOUT family RNA methylase Rps3
VVEMREWLIARAARLAKAAGAELVVEATDPELTLVANDLQTRAEAAGIQLLDLYLEGTHLHVLLDDSAADEPLSPGALQSAVRQISWQRLGQVWDAHLYTPAVEAPTAHTPAA